MATWSRSVAEEGDALTAIGPWVSLPAIYDEVVAIASVDGTLAGSAHQSRAYVDSACLYFSLRGDVDPSERADWYRKAWDAANAVIIKHGATLSPTAVSAPYLGESLGSDSVCLSRSRLLSTRRAF